MCSIVSLKLSALSRTKAMQKSGRSKLIRQYSPYWVISWQVLFSAMPAFVLSCLLTAKPIFIINVNTSWVLSPILWFRWHYLWTPGDDPSSIVTNIPLDKFIVVPIICLHSISPINQNGALLFGVFKTNAKHIDITACAPPIQSAIVQIKKSMTPVQLFGRKVSVLADQLQIVVLALTSLLGCALTCFLINMTNKTLPGQQAESFGRRWPRLSI